MNDRDTLDDQAASPSSNSRLTVLLGRATAPTDRGSIEHAFASRGWSNAWRDGIYRFHHLHSVAHEVLGIAAGRLAVRFGGTTGPEVALAAAHCKLHENRPLLVIGATPVAPRSTPFAATRIRIEWRPAGLPRWLYQLTTRSGS